MPHAVFISYATPNKTTADAVCATLERLGIRCWIAPRDIQPGANWATEIVEAIEATRLMVVVFSDHANHSGQIMREVERAVNEDRPIIPFRIEDVPLSKALSYYLSTCHWLDALTEPLEQHISRLVNTVSAVLSQTDRGHPAPVEPTNAGHPTQAETPSRRRADARAVLRIDNSGRKHYFYGGSGHHLGLGLQLSFLITNQSKGTVTLIAPEIEIDDPDTQAVFQYWRIETGSGRDTVPLGKGRTAVVKAEFKLSVRRQPSPGDEIRGLLLIRAAQPDVVAVPYKFSAIYDRDLWRP